MLLEADITMLNLPSSVTILLVIFAWRFLKTLNFLSHKRTSVYRIFFKQIKLGWLLPILVYVSLALDAFSLWCILRPTSITTTVCLISIGLSASIYCIFFVLTLRFNGVYRQAYITSRKFRRLPPMREKTLNLAVNPIVITMSFVFILFLHYLLISFIFTSHIYFESFDQYFSS
jgi:hypothetical protein